MGMKIPRIKLLTVSEVNQTKGVYSGKLEYFGYKALDDVNHEYFLTL